MAITDAKKVDYLWKKIGYGATKTDTNANKAAPNEAIASPLLIRGDKTWNQANLIPTTIPGSSSGVVTVYGTGAPDTTTNDATASTNRSWKTGLTDWIPPEFGATIIGIDWVDFIPMLQEHLHDFVTISILIGASANHRNSTYLIKYFFYVTFRIINHHF